MSSTLVRKSVTDLTRRKARAAFTVLTLGLAVASIGVFAVPAVMQQAMDREVAANRLADVTVTMKPLALRADQLAALERLPNVAAVEPRTTFSTRVYVGSRRDEAMLVGVPDFGTQRADVVALAKGEPRVGSLLVEEANVRNGDFAGSSCTDRHGRRDSTLGARQRRGPHLGRVLGMGLHDVLRAGGDRRRDRRRRGLHVARVPVARREPRGRGAHGRGRPRTVARDDRVHGVRRPSDHPRAGDLSRQDGLRGHGEHPQRRHALGPDLGAGAAVEHDDDAGRRADRGDRRDEGDRRAPAGHPADIPAHRGHVRRAGVGRRRRARDRHLEPVGRLLRATCSSASTRSSASRSRFSSRALSSDWSVRRSRRCRPFGEPPGCRSPRHCRRPARRSAARGASMRCCDAQGGCRNRFRSDCAAPGAASAARPRRRCRSHSRSERAWRCCPWAPAWPSPPADGSTTTTSTSGSSRRPARCSTPTPGARSWASRASPRHSPG